ncbi:MAG: hypothetical protein IJF65_06765, partial [Clostridia bacterium]|nr:hypothetical protein [Clostridia bacterium]
SLVCATALSPVCPNDVPTAHRWGAEPKRALWAMKRGESVANKGAWQAAAQPGDYCEPDRAQRDHWFDRPTTNPQSSGWGIFIAS